MCDSKLGARFSRFSATLGSESEHGSRTLICIVACEYHVWLARTAGTVTGEEMRKW
jgi:hypothetical protein